MPDYNQFITTNASSMTSARDLVEVLSNNKIKKVDSRVPVQKKRF